MWYFQHPLEQHHFCCWQCDYSYFMREKKELFPVLRSHFLNLIHWLVPDFPNWTFFFLSHAWMYILILLLNLMEKKNWPDHVSTFLWVKPQSLLFELLVAYGFICSFGKSFYVSECILNQYLSEFYIITFFQFCWFICNLLISSLSPVKMILTAVLLMQQTLANFASNGCLTLSWQRPHAKNSLHNYFCLLNLLSLLFPLHGNSFLTYICALL